MMTMISLEDALRVLEEFAKDYFDQYDGSGKHAVNNPNRADPYTNGKGAGMDEAAEALRSLPAVDGVVVPREPTDEMLLAYTKAVKSDLTTLFAESGAYRYKAMIAAAPKGEA